MMGIPLSSHQIVALRFTDTKPALAPGTCILPKRPLIPEAAAANKFWH